MHSKTKVVPVVSTKGGEGKSTQAANLGGFLADAGIKTLIIDGDHAQPTASSIYPLAYEAPCGLYELLMQTVDLSKAENIISRTTIDNLDVIVSKLKTKFGVDVTLRSPRVPYRETIRKSVEAEGKFVRQSGGHGQYGHCWLKLEPQEPGEGFAFENKVVGGAIPKEFIKPIEDGVKQAMEAGVVAGYPMVDIKATVFDGSFHEVDSSEAAFKVAGSMAFKNGAEKANPVLLEPYVKVEVTVPEEYMGDVIGDLNSRRGRIEGMEARNGAQVINGFVPLSEMFGYSTDLRSKTQGRGNYSMEVAYYDEVPKNIAEKVTAKNKGE